jgi:hypothetical protein
MPNSPEATALPVAKSCPQCSRTMELFDSGARRLFMCLPCALGVDAEDDDPSEALSAS